nr:hypothetical protein [Propionicimonas sp.]
MKRTAIAVAAIAVLSLVNTLAPSTSAHAANTYLTVDSSFKRIVDPSVCPGLTASDTDYFDVMDGLAYGNGHVYIIFAVPKGTSTWEKAGGTLLTEWTISGNSMWCDRAKKGLPLGHGNDLTYVPSYGSYGDVLLVPNGTKSTPRAEITVVRVSDLSSRGTIKISGTTPSGICYSTAATGYKYVVRTGNDLVGYRETSTHTVGTRLPAGPFDYAQPTETTGKQGLDCSSTSFYNVLSIAKGSGGTNNYIYQYPWSSNSPDSWTHKLVYKSADDLDTGHKAAEEVEGMFHISNTFYLGINHNGAPDVIYRLNAW